jgi:fructose-1,6-bisphosphatase III
MKSEAFGDIQDRDRELAALRTLAERFHNIDAAIAEIARLSAVLTLPKGTIHVISDIHGEDKKLRHVINNASGTLRPLVEKLFASKMSPQQLAEFITVIFYPAEVTERLELTTADPESIRAFASRVLPYQLELVRVLASRYSLRRATHSFPAEYVALLFEMMNSPTIERGHEFFSAIVDELHQRGKVLNLIHVISRLVRNLAVYELIIGGDCWDRGPRGDRVVDYLQRQPNVSFIWGNHDAEWIGACLGNDALLCSVLRFSLRYRRLAQLDEGYGIPLTPLEYLASTVYANDPAAQFIPKPDGLRPKLLVARMQKAIGIIQFKLEGQQIARNPQWILDHRRLLHRIDQKSGTIEVDGAVYPLRDRLFPTIDPANPYELSPEEKETLRRLRESFSSSQKLFNHIQYLASIGSMYLVRDDHLMFHACIPCDAKGEFLPMQIDGRNLRGRAMFDAVQRVIMRAVDKRREPDLDLLWYLWGGPRSPLFGKDRIATLERDYIADEKTHRETKDPYFQLINEVEFCDKVLAEFGVDSRRGLIVNGHVPVKIEAGESPLKHSGKAITIDGAFSEAYGDHGYTLVLESDRTVLAKHHHFDSVEAAIRDGVDIVPSVTVIRQGPVRRTGDTERGRELKSEIEMLTRLIEAYRQNLLRQRVVSAD